MPIDPTTLEDSKTGAAREEQGRHEIFDGVLALKDYCQWPFTNLDRLAKVSFWAATRGGAVHEQKDNRRTTHDGIIDLDRRDVVKPFEPDNFLPRDHSRQSGGLPSNRDQVWSFRTSVDGFNSDSQRQNRSTMMYRQSKHPINGPYHTLFAVAPSIAKPVTGVQVEIWDSIGEPTWASGKDPFARPGKQVTRSAINQPEFLTAGIKSKPDDPDDVSVLGLARQNLVLDKQSFSNIEFTARTRAVVALHSSSNGGHVYGYSAPRTDGKTSGIVTPHLSQLWHVFAPIWRVDLGQLQSQVDEEDTLSLGWLGLRSDAVFASPRSDIYGPLSILREQWDYGGCGTYTNPDYCHLGVGDLYFSNLGNRLSGSQVYDPHPKSDVQGAGDYPESPWTLRVVTQSGPIWYYLDPPTLFKGNFRTKDGSDKVPFGLGTGILSAALAPDVDWSVRMKSPLTYIEGERDSETTTNGFRFGHHWDFENSRIDEIVVSYFRNGKRFVERRHPPAGDGTFRVQAKRLGFDFENFVADLHDFLPHFELNDDQSNELVEVFADFLESLAFLSNGADVDELATKRFERVVSTVEQIVSRLPDSDYRAVSFLHSAFSRPPFSKIPVSSSASRFVDRWRLAVSIINEMAAHQNRKRLDCLLELPDKTVKETTDDPTSELIVCESGTEVSKCVGKLDFNDCDFDAKKVGIAVEVNALVPDGYIHGARLAFVDTDTVSLGTAGQVSKIKDSTDCKQIKFTGTLTADRTVNGPGGLDYAGSASGALHSMYVIEDTTGIVATANPALVFSLSHTGPILPAGYDISARVGSVLLDASTTEVVPFIQVWNGRTRRMLYIDTRGNLQVLFAGSAAVFTDVPLSAFMPPTSTNVLLDAFFEDLTDPIQLRPDGSTATDTFWRFEKDANQKTQKPMEMPTSAAQVIEFITGSASGDHLDLFVMGYDDEL